MNNWQGAKCFFQVKFIELKVKHEILCTAIGGIAAERKWLFRDVCSLFLALPASWQKEEERFLNTSHLKFKIWSEQGKWDFLNQVLPVFKNILAMSVPVEWGQTEKKSCLSSQRYTMPFKSLVECLHFQGEKRKKERKKTFLFLKGAL